MLKSGGALFTGRSDQRGAAMTLSSGLSIGGLIGFGTFTSLAAKIGVQAGSA